jgi:hypothetical protein
LSPDHNNGHGPQQEARQTRGVGDGVDKPRVNVVLGAGEKGHYTYAGAVGKVAPKQLEAGTVVTPVSNSNRGSASVPAIETIPKIQAQPKIRLPLRFFPNQNPPNQQRKLGKGLSISISDNGKRRVLWSSNLETKAETQSRELSRDKWVPKINNMDTKGPAVDHLLVGSKDRPTFEIDGHSRSVAIGSAIGPEIIPQ